MISEKKIEAKLLCYHCGDEVINKTIKHDEKHFCCEGCKMVYEIINQNNLCNYYDLEKNPGITQKHKVREGKFAFLDDKSIQTSLIHFTQGNQSHVQFYLPQMHCSSCIWILEHLNKLQPGIIKSQVDFLKKEILVVFEHDHTGLRKIAETLTSIGYEPHINLSHVNSKKISKYDKSRIFKIGISGFAFGNIMMMSFPEYFSLGTFEEEGMRDFLGYFNLILALPVFFYSASEFFISAWKGFKQKIVNIDAPIALAVLITFGRSFYEVVSGTGAGYFDSMTGIVFFMLIGRYFQGKTYDTLSFERDYTSYFPIGVTVLNENGNETQIPVSNLKIGQRIKIHSHEIIPADSILFLGKANIDYSFVTGESLPVEKNIGEIIYAGGKQIGGAIELEVVKEVSQSYLTKLWNNDVFKENQEEKKESFIHSVSRYFTLALFSVAAAAVIYWSVYDSSKVWNALTAVLIVACPCALLLSATFTNGSLIRLLGKLNLYVKNANVIERISEADTVVFDKTGTITRQQEAQIIYNGPDLTEAEQQLVRSLANQSNHPLSKSIVSFLPFSKTLSVKNFKEEKGKGVSGVVNGVEIKLGSAGFMNLGKAIHSDDGSNVYVMINGEINGCFVIKNVYREGLIEVADSLRQNYKLAIISGDNDNEKAKLEAIFGKETHMLFNQKPEDKLEFIKSLQQQGHKTIMIGDGLNDAGALKQSDVGIAITDNINNFSPACDAILSGEKFKWLNGLINYCKKEKQIIYGSFIISILYNIVGLFFAVQGTLEPVIAAILMPASSISIVLFTTGMSSFYYLKLKSKIDGNKNSIEQY